MRYRRSPSDEEGLRRVLLLCGLILGLAGVAFGAAGVLRGGWGLVAGPALIVFAVACALVARDDATGEWCSECIARNPAGTTTCASCGSALV
jgi:ribosomal protein L40E